MLGSALDAVEPRQAVLERVRRDGDHLIIDGESIDLGPIERVLLIGSGKAGAPMAQAIEQVLGDRLDAGHVNVKRGHGGPLRLTKVQEAGHPLPDADGVAGTEAIVRLLAGVNEHDLVLCVLSGGGSALLTLPRESISLADLQHTTNLLLRAGATINELNAVRKHLDRVKGGGLARFAAPATLRTLILSDVIGDPLDVIASGPTVPDPTTFADASAIIDRFNLWDELPASVRELLISGRQGLQDESPKQGDSIFDRVRNLLVGNNAIAVNAAIQDARDSGWNVLDLGSRLEGEAREIGRALSSLARSIALDQRPLAAPACILIGGESTVTVHGQGKGGRNQELALGAALALDGLENVLVASLGTDGTDGPTDAAGALADGITVNRARQAGLDPHQILRENDSYRLFDRLGDLLVTGPTRTNVNDVTVLLVGAPPPG